MKRKASFLISLAVLAAPCAIGAEPQLASLPAGQQNSGSNAPSQALAGNAIDTLVLGDSASQKDHGFSGKRWESLAGGLDEPAVRLLPLQPASHDGGSVSFTMKIDPEKQNYVSVRLWGSDTTTKTGHMLLLFAEGKQVGYRRESDYDPLSWTEADPQAPGRFFYETRPLPLAMTRGKTSISLRIQALGSVYNYGEVWEKYQRKLEEPSRGIYRVYTHTDPRFAPPASEKQGVAPVGKLRISPGPEVIERSREIVIDRIRRTLEKPADPSSGNLAVLAEAYRVKWTPAYQNPKALERVLIEGDRFANRFSADPKFNGGWMGTWTLAGAIVDTWPAIEKHLDEPFTADKSRRTRREVWSLALRQSIDYWRANRRVYTNQAMLVDGGIYRSNLALQRINPTNALPEKQALRYIREAVGLDPWSDSDIIDAKGERRSNLYGGNYHLVSRKGLSRELGWVGSYGETILSITRELADITGDDDVRRQLAKLQEARLYFRYPVVDEAGYSGLKISSEIDNRHSHFPQYGMAYSAPESIKEHWGMEVAAVAPESPASVGVAKRYIADGHYFAHIEKRLKDGTLAQMRNIEDYEKVARMSAPRYVFPMEDGRPDFVFADPENAVIALKHGDTRLFVNLYFRAEYAVNNVAKIMEITPANTRLVTARTNSVVKESGETYTRPDYIDWIRTDTPGRIPPGPKIHQAWAGEKLPVSPRPEGATLPKSGNWGPFVGKAAFYWLQYGDYLIGLNTTETDTCDLPVPAAEQTRTDLVTGKSVTPVDGVVKVAPLSAVILHTGNDK